MSGIADSWTGDLLDDVTELVVSDEACAGSRADESPVASLDEGDQVLEPGDGDPGPEPGAETSDRGEAAVRTADRGREVAERVRARGERVRRRELETALQRLGASGEVSPEQRRVLDRLSARITAALVERWTARLADDGVDPETALELLADEE